MAGSGDPASLLLQYIREQDENGLKQLVKTLGKRGSIEAAASIKHMNFTDAQKRFYKRMVDEINTEGGIGASRRKSRKTKRRRITRRR